MSLVNVEASRLLDTFANAWSIINNMTELFDAEVSRKFTLEVLADLHQEKFNGVRVNTSNYHDNQCVLLGLLRTLIERT